MGQPPHNVQLDATLSNLATLSPTERGGILNLLEPGKRLQVERLLRRFDQENSSMSAQALIEAGISPWLADRLAKHSLATQSMTPDAATLLARCAQPHLGQTPSTKPSLFERLGSRFKRGELLR